MQATAINKGIYAITDPQLLPDEQLYCGVEAALNAGVKLVQYRDKHASNDQKMIKARRLLSLCSEYGAQLIINDSTDLALAVGSHGVHLGQDDGSVEEARARLGPEAIIGVTCHQSLDLARQAQKHGATYVAFGAFFSSQTKPLAKLAPLDLIHQARGELKLPIVAIGGIQTSNMHLVAQAGADIVAVCNSLFAGPDIGQNAQDLIQLFNSEAQLNSETL